MERNVGMGWAARENGGFMYVLFGHELVWLSDWGQERSGDVDCLQ